MKPGQTPGLSFLFYSILERSRPMQQVVVMAVRKLVVRILLAIILIL